MVFERCISCAHEFNTSKRSTHDCLSRDDDQEVTDSGYTGA